MKIGVISGIFHPETGGPPTYLYHLLPELQAAGHEINVLTFGEDDHDNYGYPVVKIARRGSRWRRLLRFLREGFGLLSRSDTLFVMGYVFPLLLFRPFFRRRIVAKVVSDHSWEYAERNHFTTHDVNTFQTAAMPFKLRVFRWLYHRAVRSTNAVIVPSEHVAQLVRGWGVPPQNVHIIYNAIPENDLHTRSRQALRKELNLPTDAYLLVSVARLTPVKGVDVAIKALKHLPECHFVVVGEGVEQAELERLAREYAPERVHFVGAKPHEDVLKYMRAADVFVLSSRTEGLSHVLLESLSVGTPAVATAVGGNPEVLTNERNGLLVPSEDPAALAAAVERLRNDPVFAEQIITGARKRSADFSWAVTVSRTEALLRGS